MALRPTYTVVNGPRVAQGKVDLLLGVANEAYRLWGAVLAGSADLSVRIEILGSTLSGRAEGTWGNGTTVGIGNGGYFLGVGAPAYELMSGQNAPQSAGFDVIIRFQADYLVNELFLDSTPQTRGDTPSNRTDGLSVLLHEIGHALGFTGYWNEGSNSFNGYNTPYDQRLVLTNGEATFVGPNTRAVYGRAVPLTDNNYMHYGNTSADPRTSNDPLTGLMNGVFFYRGYSYTIGDLDLAMLADMGLGTIRDDILNAAGHVYLRGGRGNDAITGSVIDNFLFGDEDNDRIYGLGGNDKLFGGSGDDALDGGAGADAMNGGSGNDSFYRDNVGDVITEAAAGGIDTVRTALQYTLDANVENVVLTGGSAANATGNSLANSLTGNGAANRISGRGGADTIKGGGGNDILKGDGDAAAGGDAADTVFGGTGNDSLYGGRGNDTLRGDDNFAQHGKDKFYFDTVPSATANRDTILDFNPVDDGIYLKKSIFAGIATLGTLGPAAFKQIDNYNPASPGARTSVTDDYRIIYDKVSGKLYYDADGHGGGATAAWFATVSNGAAHPALTNADFITF